MTVSELQSKLTNFAVNGCGDYEITIDGVELHGNAIGLDHLCRQVTIRPAHYKSPQYDAAKKLGSTISNAINDYFDNCREVKMDE